MYTFILYATYYDNIEFQQKQETWRRDKIVAAKDSFNRYLKPNYENFIKTNFKNNTRIKNEKLKELGFNTIVDLNKLDLINQFNRILNIFANPVNITFEQIKLFDQSLTEIKEKIKNFSNTITSNINKIINAPTQEEVNEFLTPINLIINTISISIEKFDDLLYPFYIKFLDKFTEKQKLVPFIKDLNLIIMISDKGNVDAKDKQELLRIKNLKYDPLQKELEKIFEQNIKNSQKCSVFCLFNENLQKFLNGFNGQIDSLIENKHKINKVVPHKYDAPIGFIIGGKQDDQQQHDLKYKAPIDFSIDDNEQEKLQDYKQQHDIKQIKIKNKNSEKNSY